ncbi:MAG: hypothetical protein ABI183_04635, partial [Polyangiaceae bacterium]
MRSLSWVLGCTLLVCGCPSSVDKNGPTNPTTASASAAAPLAPVRTTAQSTASGPSWHWMNPQPQGNSLYAVVASHECGVVAVGEQSTVMRSIDDGLTWSTHQSDERWRFKAAALSGTDIYVVGDNSDANVILKIGSCGEAEPVTVRKLTYKADGAANGVAVDSDGRIYVSTV